MVGDGFHLADAALDPSGALDALETTGVDEEVEESGVSGDGGGHGDGMCMRQCVPRVNSKSSCRGDCDA